MADKWQNNYVQFARLLAEISATQDKLDLKALSESMDLPKYRINELFDRANTAWESTKNNVSAWAPTGPYSVEAVDEEPLWISVPCPDERGGEVDDLRAEVRIVANGDGVSVAIWGAVDHADCPLVEGWVTWAEVEEEIVEWGGTIAERDQNE